MMVMILMMNMILNFKLSNMVGENLKHAIKDVKKFDDVITFIDESLKRKNKSI